MEHHQGDTSSYYNSLSLYRKPVRDSFVTAICSWRTGEAVEGQLVNSFFCALVIIWQDGQGIFIIVERVASDDAQVVQRDHRCFVQGYEHVASDFFDGLKKNEELLCSNFSKTRNNDI